MSPVTAVRPLDVALLSPCFWPEVRRGTERFTRDLADGLLTRGHHPRLITSVPGRPSRAIEDGLPILRLPRPPQDRLVRRKYMEYMTHVPLSYAALQFGNDDIAHAVYPADALAAIRWRRQTGRPALLSFMGIPDFNGLRSRRRLTETMLAATAGCDAIVALSEYAGDAFRKWLGYEPRVISPGVDLTAFALSDERSDPPTIVCSADAGEERKQVALLIEAFKIVRRRRRSVRLRLSIPRNRQKAERVGVDFDVPGVDWVDLDDRSALARAYGEATVAVLPSRSEAFGLVLIEAMACGTPVVGFDHAAIPEVINSPAIGRLFSEATPKSLAAALVETLDLAKDPATSASCRARAEQFSVDVCTDRYVELYNELVLSARG